MLASAVIGEPRHIDPAWPGLAAAVSAPACGRRSARPHRKRDHPQQQRHAHKAADDPCDLLTRVASILQRYIGANHRKPSTYPNAILAAGFELSALRPSRIRPCRASR